MTHPAQKLPALSESELPRNPSEICANHHKLISKHVSRQALPGQALKNSPLNISDAFCKQSQNLMRDPRKFLGAQVDLLRDY